MDKTNKLLAIAVTAFLLASSFWLINDILTGWANPATATESDTALNVSNSEFAKVVRENYRIYSSPVPDSISFAGEPVPLHETEVHERLDKELVINTFWHSQTIFFHKIAARWFPIIEPILKEENVPDDLKYLALIESGLSDVVSPAGAAGFWQFMPATARGYGLEVNKYVDERYNLEKVTLAACKLLKDGYGKFGSWTLSAAGYNMGITGLEGRLTDQGVERYYDALLPEETMRYVFRIVAAKQILTHSADYGFRFRPSDLYEPYKVMEFKTTNPIADLNAFAKQNGTTLRILKLLNPWLLLNSLPNSQGKEYVIKLPAEGFNR